MTNEILFFLVILVANIIHGITGFAGTVLAMPPSLMLVGYPVAKPVLNVLGLLSGVYVYVGHKQHINWKELKKIVLFMTVGIMGGIVIKGFFAGKEQIMYILLGIFIIYLSIQGLVTLFKKEKADDTVKETEVKENKLAAYGLLGLAGIAHGIFVSGGPLLIGYLTKRTKDKVSFRATISTVWIFLNSIILIDDIRAGFWTADLMITQLISIPFLFAGMYIGSKLYAKMSQRLFMLITYVLLFISGISLLLK